MTADPIEGAGAPEAPEAPESGSSAPEAPEAPLRLREIAVRYPGRRDPAIHGIDLDVAAGERLAVAGRTGAGKSTLALAAAGFIPRVVRARLHGHATIDGVDVTGPARDLLGRVGIVFATPANQLSASKLTVREELAFGLENLGVARGAMDERIEATLGRLGIAHLAERSPFALSGGEQQRVAIASIVVMGTRVLVLDEPTAQLDPAGTVAVGEVLAELAAEGVAVLIAEHDPSILGAADRAIVLDGGRIVAEGVPGAALAAAEADPVALPAPTLVRLAAAAGLPPGQAFDEAAIAAGLERGGGDSARRTAGAAAAAPATTWEPARDRRPVSISIEGLVHRYEGGLEAVRGASLDLPAGDAVAIVGQNGSGKTTLAKHLNGLLRPAEGRVLLDGADTATIPVHELARTVGFVFQNPDDQLFERSLAREVGFGPRNLGLEPAAVDRTVDAALAATGLADERDTNPYDLDLSRRKLVALASILAMDPAVLVLDEPTTGQDPGGVALVGGVVDAWRRAGRTVVAITHDMEFAARHFGRIVVMRQGSVVLDGEPAEAFAPDQVELLASTGLVAPPAARIAARLGLDSVPATAAELFVALEGRPRS